MSKMAYIGIADCHGIESFIPLAEGNATILSIRANANAHRHAVVYMAKVTQVQADKINDLMARGKYKEALQYLKRNVKDISVQRGREKSWNLIPNPDLDPWG